MSARLTESDFWERVDRSGGPDACWPWRMYVDPTGYGKLQARDLSGLRRPVQAHRLAYVLEHGIAWPAAEIHVHHLCENRVCCNPAHLDLIGQVEHGHHHNGGAGCAIHGLENWRPKANESGGDCRICDRERKRRLRSAPETAERYRSYERARWQRRQTAA